MARHCRGWGHPLLLGLRPYLVCLTCNDADGQVELAAALTDVCKGVREGAAGPDTHGALIHQWVCLESCDLWSSNCSCRGAYAVADGQPMAVYAKGPSIAKQGISN